MVDDVVEIRFGGRHIRAQKGIPLMEALVAAGVMLRSDCGGRGRCGKCRVRLANAPHSAADPPDEREQNVIKDADLEAGWRLSCCTRVREPLRLEIPEGSLVAPEVVQKGLPSLPAPFVASSRAAQQAPSPAYGVAVDLGTTTIAVFLCDVANRCVAGSITVRNPQAIFGDDVISRIGAVLTAGADPARLQKMAVSAIDWAVSSACRRFGIELQRIGSMVVVGNSAMIHLLLGEDPSCIGVFPYAPRFTHEQARSGGDIGLAFNPAVRLRTLPLISGFLGADIVGAALAADMTARPPGTLLVDVGTNGEILLRTETGFAATSCATGPALEGAAIQHGMQASSGAVDRVCFDPQTGRLDYTLIQNDPSRPQPPAGLCGSGVISTVAALLRAGAITRSGRFEAAFPSLSLSSALDGTHSIEIVPGRASRDGAPIVFTQADVRAVQLAKGALRTGIELLCRENRMERPSRILLAGAFGSYINQADALCIGMFPEMATEAIEVVGNAAGAGAILALCDDAYFQQAQELIQRTRVVDLAAHPEFQSIFVRHLSF